MTKVICWFDILQKVKIIEMHIKPGNSLKLHVLEKNAAASVPHEAADLDFSTQTIRNDFYK